MGTVLFIVTMLASFALVIWGLQTLDTKEQGPIRLAGWAAVIVGAPILLFCCGIAILAGI